MLEIGEPPYYGGDVTFHSMVYLNYLSMYMQNDPNIYNGSYHTMRDIGSEEYGIFDKVYYLIGLMNTFNHVYPQLYDIDLREDYPKLEVPLYFLLGRHDINAPHSLVEEYYDIVEAPHKEIIYFEHSGHSPWMNETEKFIEVVREVNYPRLRRWGPLKENRVFTLSQQYEIHTGVFTTPIRHRICFGSLCAPSVYMEMLLLICYLLH